VDRQATDARTYVAVCALAALVPSVAACLPARRASAVDPLSVVRLD